MNYSKFILTALILPVAVSAKKIEKPNIVIIYADDVGYGDLSCYGATKVKTPNIDRLASEGRVFTNMHSGSSVSTPSRIALLTGEHPSRTHKFGAATWKSNLQIKEDKLTLADVLSRSGYKTAIIGKWHLGFGGKNEKPNWDGELKPGPLEVGFDYFYGIPVVNSAPPYVLVENHRVLGYDPSDPFDWDGFPPTKEYPEKVLSKTLGGAKSAHDLYLDDMLGTTFCEKSVQWIKENKKDPFFLYLATTNIHHPFTPHPRFIGTSEAGLYGDFIHELDWIVGEIMQTLKKEKLDKNTLVIFSSDNGAMINAGGQEAMEKGHKINGDLFGFKFDAWEGGHNVPLIVNYPGKTKAGSVSKQLISNLDILHSIASLVGYQLEDGDAVDSFNMLPALLGETEDELRPIMYSSAHQYTHIAYRKGDWVYIDAPGGGGFSAPSGHTFGGYHAANYYGKQNSDAKLETPQARQLYNLKDDPCQTTNLAESMPEKADQMREEYLEIKNSKATRY